MTGGFLTRYAKDVFTPEHRASLFVDAEHRLTWTSLFYQAFPNADIYLVGGTLRDALLGRLPDDIDIVIRNVPIEKLEQWLQNHGAFEIAGKRFGTFKFAPHGCRNRTPIDIALPRKEFVNEDHKSGRRDLDVQFDPYLPIREDLSRRDFTVNAMAFDFRRCRMIDPFDGYTDLHDGIVRAVNNPSERFFEDATRMIRGLRFASQLGFAIEEHTWRGIREFVGLLNNTTMREDGTHEYVIPREAIGKEFLLGFAVHPTHTLNLWKSAGALGLFLPSIDRLSDIVEDDGQNAFEKTLRTLHMLQKPSLLSVHKMHQPAPTTLVAGLFSYIDGEQRKEATHACKRLYFHQFPQDHPAHVDCSDVLWMVERLRAFEKEDPASMRPHEFEKTFCNQRGQQLLLLMHAVQVASGRHSVARERLHTARRIFEQMSEVICPDGKTQLEPLITGHDLKDLGVPEGPQYRELKNNIRDAQLTHRIHSKNEALDLVRHLLSQG